MSASTKIKPTRSKGKRTGSNFKLLEEINFLEKTEARLMDSIFSAFEELEERLDIQNKKLEKIIGCKR